MIYLFLSILFSTLLVLIFKAFEKFNIDNFQAIVFNYITAGLICFIFLEVPLGLSTLIDQKWFPSAVLIGVLFISLFNLIAYSVQNIGIATTSVANKISLCFPVIFGFIYLGDSVNLFKLIGILFALIAVYLTSLKEQENLNSLKPNLLFIPLLLFFGSGLLDIIFIYSLDAYDLVDEKLELKFSLVIYFIASIIGAILLCVKSYKTKQINSKNIIAGVCLGIPNVLSIVYFLKCLNYYPNSSSFIFPINNIGIVSFSALTAWIIFKEKLSKINVLGIFTALISILLLSISS